MYQIETACRSRHFVDCQVAKRTLPRNSKAFTLVELLVVIAIMAILVLMLLPAVNAARESARRIKCANNVKQIGLAVLAFHEANGGFPISQTGSGQPTTGGGCEAGYFSWHARILPFIDEEAVYNMIDFTVNMSDSCTNGAPISVAHVNAPAAAAVVGTYLCPADGILADNLLLGSADPAPENYAANAGWPSLATGYEGERDTPGSHNGLITLQNPGRPVSWHPKTLVRQRDVKDGMSKTAMVAERLIQHGQTAEEILNSRDSLLALHLTSHPRTLPKMAEKCDPALTHSDLSTSAYIGRSWISGWTSTGATYMHVKTPNTTNCHFVLNDTEGDVLITPSSNHPHGVNVVMGDGHVEFILDDVDATIWWALGSRNGGEQIGGFH